MLTQYIVEYAKARKSGDKKEMARIEKDLGKVGMDALTLSMLRTMWTMDISRKSRKVSNLPALLFICPEMLKFGYSRVLMF